MDGLGGRDDEEPGYGLTPLPGGHSGETFLAEAAGERTVVRVYGGRGARRGPAAVEVDAAVLRLVHRLLPVPDVLEVRRPDPVAGTPAVLVTSHLPGVPLASVLAGWDDERVAVVGAALGRLLARLAGMPMLRAGLFVDGGLRVEPFPPVADLVGWVEQHRRDTALEQWPAADLDALLEVAATAQEVLDRTDRACLVHSDFNAKNLLVAPDTGDVTGVVDWEFAHAGSPFSDLGNLLRFDRRPALVDAVCSTYLDLLGQVDEVADQEELLLRARAADLLAVVDLAARRGENPVTEQAHRLLLAVARTGRLDAVP